MAHKSQIHAISLIVGLLFIPSTGFTTSFNDLEKMVLDNEKKILTNERKTQDNEKDIKNLNDRTKNTDYDKDHFTPAEGDCNDADDMIYPGAPVIIGDGIDQDCDGIAE